MKKKRQKIARSIKKNRELYLFLLLPFLVTLIFKYGPMAGLVVAFEDFKMSTGIWGSEWVGFDNFIKFFKNYNFERVLVNTLTLSAYNIIAGFPIPIIFALLLNSLRNERFKKITQSITCLPHFISTVVMVGIVFQLFDCRTGLYGIIVEAITGQYPDDILGSPSVFRHLYVWSGIWQGFGWSSIIYTAALAGVDPTYHEAAQIDGATRLQRILYIDLPSIKPTIITLLIMRMGNVMTVGFEKVYLMQNTLNLSASEVISTYSYRVGLAGTSTDLSYGAAIGLFNSVVNIILLVTANKISQKYSESSLW